MEHRITVILGGYGRDEDAAERLLEAFLGLHPEVGAVVSANLPDDTLAVTFSLDADDWSDAVEHAKPIFRESAHAAALKPVPIVHVDVDIVPVDEPAETPELQPA